MDGKGIADQISSLVRSNPKVARQISDSMNRDMSVMSSANLDFENLLAGYYGAYERNKRLGKPDIPMSYSLGVINVT